MRVSVFGLGYVGAVSCGCFASDGIDVIGVDVNPDKVRMVNEGRAPIVEEAIGDLIAQGVRDGRLRATSDTAEAVHASELSVVSVGTPSEPNGSLNLTAVQRVSEQIGHALAGKAARHLVVVRSTILPGTIAKLVIPTIERASGKRAGEGFGICFNPEFLREGSSVRDHYRPPFTLIGHRDDADARAAAALYAKVDAPLHLTTIEAAEMVKYVCNAYHALKITFANEIGIFASSVGLDSHEVMRLVCLDTKLNVSAAYLTPGFAFGGSCLPKDLRALLQHAKATDLDLPLLASILPSNRAQIDRVVQIVRGLGRKRVALLGLSFKAGTDDLRESPLVVLAEALIGKGYDLSIYDPNVSLARLTGANRDYIEREIPHLAQLLVADLSQAMAHGDVVVIGNACASREDIAALARADQHIVDLVRLPDESRRSGDQYHGVAW